MKLSRFVTSFVSKFTIVCALSLAFEYFSAAAMFAQTVQFDGTQRPVALGFSEPVGLAVDQYGNLFVADAETYWISEILAVNGQIPLNPTVRQLYRDSGNPKKIAVDHAGNVYFTDLDTSSNFRNNTVKEILAVDGSIPASPAVIQLGSGLFYPGGIAIDASGDVFVADTNNSVVKEFVAVNGSVPSSPTIVTLGSGFGDPQAVTVDSAGDVYVADSGNQAVKEIVAVNGSIPASPTILTLASNYCILDGLSLDSQGNLYFSDYCNAAIYEIQAVNGSIPPSPVIKTFSRGAGLSGIQDVAVDSNQNVYAGGVFNATQIPQVFPSDFGAVRVGTTAAATPFEFTFIGPVTVGSVSVDGVDFADAGTGTCVAGGYYNSPSGYSLCTVDLMFSPKFAGTRSGAVLLKDSTGKTIATGFVNGTGVAPLVNFVPPTLSTAVSGTVWAGGVAIDSSGNLYASIPGQNQVVKEIYMAGSYTQTVLPTSSLSSPNGVAVDGAGNVFIADTGNYRVLKETPTVGGYFESVVADNIGGNPGTGPIGVAVDGQGSVFILTVTGMLFIKNPIYGSLNVFPVAGLTSASGLAVDASGKLYMVANTTSGSIVVETPSGNSYLESSIPIPGGGVPTGVAVDSWGNVFVTYVVTSGQQSQILKASPTSGGYVQTTIVSGGLDEPFGLAVDQNGNLFVADSGNSRIVKIDSSDPPSLTFASTTVGATSPDSPQTVTLENIGNADLTFPIPASGNNPSISANFTLDENAPSACPVVGSISSSPATLAAGSSCVLPISFAPTTEGSLSGSLVFTDDNLNTPAPAYSSQTISLSGTSTAPVPAAMTSPAPGSTLAGPVNTFTWTTGSTGTTTYYLWVGTSFGTNNLVNWGLHTTSLTVTLPTNGATLYVRLWSVINGVFLYQDYTYTEPTVGQANLVSPAPGTTLAGPVNTFTWTTGPAGTTAYYLWIGTSFGTNNLLNSGLHTTSLTVTLPTNGATLYVRLWSVVNGVFVYNDYTYIESSVGSASLVSPAPGSTLAGPINTFTWTTGPPGTTTYYLWVGTSFGTNNLVNSGLHTTSLTVTLPTKGATLYVRLWSVVNGVFVYNDYTYTESSVGSASLISPAPGSTLAGPINTFTWTAGPPGTTTYYLWVGTSFGTNNLVNSGLHTTSLTVTLPTSGATLYVRLWSVINGVFMYNDYTYTEGGVGQAILSAPNPAPDLTRDPLFDGA